MVKNHIVWLINKNYTVTELVNKDFKHRYYGHCIWLKKKNRETIAQVILQYGRGEEKKTTVELLGLKTAVWNREYMGWG